MIWAGNGRWPGLDRDSRPPLPPATLEVDTVWRGGLGGCIGDEEFLQWFLGFCLLKAIRFLSRYVCFGYLVAEISGSSSFGSIRA